MLHIAASSLLRGRYKEPRSAQYAEANSRRGRPLALRGGWQARRRKRLATQASNGGLSSEGAHGGHPAPGGRPASFSATARKVLEGLSSRRQADATSRRIEGKGGTGKEAHEDVVVGEATRGVRQDGSGGASEVARPAAVVRGSARPISQQPARSAVKLPPKTLTKGEIIARLLQSKPSAAISHVARSKLKKKKKVSSGL